MDNASAVTFTKRMTSETMPYFVGFGIAILLESLAVHFLARIWLNLGYSLLVTVGHFTLGVLLLYFLFINPVRVPHLLTGDALILRHGCLLKAVIPLSEVVSIEDTNLKHEGLDGLVLDRNEKTGVMFILTGKTNKLLLTLKEPVRVKGLRNYGYADKFVFNLDEPARLKELLKPENGQENAAYQGQEVSENKVEEKPGRAGRAGLIAESAGTDDMPGLREPVLSLQDVCKTFGEVVAVQNLNLSLYPGEIFGLLGPNGSGKTTTLNMIAGLMRTTGGCVNFGPMARVAYMPESMMLYERLSGREFLEFIAVLHDIDPGVSKREIENNLARFEMVRAADRPIGSYSTGMKRKIALIGTILKGSSVLLLDEPTNGLDPMGIMQVKELLRELVKGGKTVVVSTHILDMAEKLCDRVGVMAWGKLLFVGTVPELRVKTDMEKASLEEIFIRLVGEGGDGQDYEKGA